MNGFEFYSFKIRWCSVIGVDLTFERSLHGRKCECIAGNNEREKITFDLYFPRLYLKLSNNTLKRSNSTGYHRLNCVFFVCLIANSTTFSWQQSTCGIKMLSKCEFT